MNNSCKTLEYFTEQHARGDCSWIKPCILQVWEECTRPVASVIQAFSSKTQEVQTVQNPFPYFNIKDVCIDQISRSYGLMFDMRAQQDLVVKSLWMIMGQNASSAFSIYYREGSIHDDVDMKASFGERIGSVRSSIMYRSGVRIPTDLRLTAGKKYCVYIHSSYTAWCGGMGVLYRWVKTANSSAKVAQDKHLAVATTGVRVVTSPAEFAEITVVEETSSVPINVEYYLASDVLNDRIYLTNYNIDMSPIGQRRPGLGDVDGFGFEIEALDETILLEGLSGMTVKDWCSNDGYKVLTYSQMPPEHTRRAPRADEEKLWALAETFVDETCPNWINFEVPVKVKAHSVCGIILLKRRSYQGITYEMYDNPECAGQDRNLRIRSGGYRVKEFKILENGDITGFGKDDEYFGTIWMFHGKMKYVISS